MYLVLIHIPLGFAFVLLFLFLLHTSLGNYQLLIMSVPNQLFPVSNDIYYFMQIQNIHLLNIYIFCRLNVLFQKRIYYVLLYMLFKEYRNITYKSTFVYLLKLSTWYILRLYLFYQTLFNIIFKKKCYHIYKKFSSSKKVPK